MQLQFGVVRGCHAVLGVRDVCYDMSEEKVRAVGVAMISVTHGRVCLNTRGKAQVINTYVYYAQGHSAAVSSRYTFISSRLLQLGRLQHDSI